MRVFKTRVRVRYAETDAAGIVYYNNFFVYFELGRVEMFRELAPPTTGVSHRRDRLPLPRLRALRRLARDRLLRRGAAEQRGPDRLQGHRLEGEERVLLAEGHPRRSPSGRTAGRCRSPMPPDTRSPPDRRSRRPLVMDLPAPPRSSSITLLSMGALRSHDPLRGRARVAVVVWRVAFAWPPLAAGAVLDVDFCSLIRTTLTSSPRAE